MTEIKIIENTSEIAAGTRGASLGVGALKVVAHNHESELFGKYERYIVEDENELLNRPVQYPTAKRIEGVVQVYQNVSDVVSHVLDNDNFPLVLAGDHASAGGTIAGIKKSHPDKRLGVIWIDAHADLHTPYTTPSGNIHGMPLATALGTDNLESQINDPVEEVKTYWNQMKDLNGVTPKIQSEDLVFIAVRDTEKPEDDLMERRGIRNFSVDEVRQKGLQTVVTEIKEKLSDCDIVYVSFDVDSMDCILVSKGTGTPVENGLTPEEAEHFVRQFSSWDKCCCVEFVEINPCLDNKINKMAEVAFDILDKTLIDLENRL
ncbi:MAG: arginase [Flavobacteriales bacterium]|nr:arginase [Flavobacteriales bacterium]